MEPYDDRSKDLVVDLLILASVKAGGKVARPGLREALRSLPGTFVNDGSIDLSGAWDTLQAEGGVERDAASDACAFLKSLETRLGASIRAPLAAVARPAKGGLLPDAELDRFVMAAAIRPKAAGTRTLPGITNHLVGGHAVAASRASNQGPGGSGPQQIAATEETTDVREQHAIAKLDAIYGGVPNRTSSQMPAQAPKQSDAWPTTHTSGTRPVMRAGGMVDVPARSPAELAQRAKIKRIAAIALSVVAVVLFALVLVPSFRDESREPTVLAAELVAPLPVSDLRVLGPDAIATLTDETTWPASPVAIRTGELERALGHLRPHKVVRLTVRAGTRVVASAHLAGGAIVVRFGR